MKASGIGGQALMEGVMMKNGNKYACAGNIRSQLSVTIRAFALTFC